MDLGLRKKTWNQPFCVENITEDGKYGILAIFQVKQVVSIK